MSAPPHVYDLAVVGSGPAGSAAAIGALRADPALDVALVDAADFPRDKPCGDGVAPHVLDLLAAVGVPGLLDDRVPVPRLRLVRGPLTVERTMARPAYVVPRMVFDERLRRAALAAGARPVRARVRGIEDQRHGEPLALRLGRGNDGGTGGTGGTGGAATLHARTVVAADGARSVLRHALGARSGSTALALRGYAPVSAGREGRQVIAFGTHRQPSYAWSFDRGDGLANVGYGELLADDRPPPTRARLLEWLEDLLPGAPSAGADWRGHHLPLSGAAPLRPGRGRVLLAGDAAGLVNPLTGEGIYYAVATGLLAGRHAADSAAPLPPYTRELRRLLGAHLRHTALAATLSRRGAILDAGLRAAGRDQAVFDDLVELGLARGQLRARTVTALARGIVRPPQLPRSDPSQPTGGRLTCGS